MPDNTALIALSLSSGVLSALVVALIVLAERERRVWRELLSAKSLSEYANAQRLMKPVVKPATPPKPDYLSVFDSPPGPRDIPKA